MSSNSPSGGTKVMALSLSNLGSLTHCLKNLLNIYTWNLRSSMVIPLSD